MRGGGERDRTDDLLRARQALSQLSYTPTSDDRGPRTEDGLARRVRACAFEVFLSSVFRRLASDAWWA